MRKFYAAAWPKAKTPHKILANWLIFEGSSRVGGLGAPRQKKENFKALNQVKFNKMVTF
jgi:hypothetical protein